MPKRILDADAIWASSKLEKCLEWTIPEYSWLYGLADANGNFELTNLRVVHGKAYAVRPHFSVDNLKDVLNEFYRHGLLFIWMEGTRTYGHWTGSEKKGRLPPPSQRNNYGIIKCMLPNDQMTKYLEDVIETELGQEMLQTSLPELPQNGSSTHSLGKHLGHALKGLGLGLGLGVGLGRGLGLGKGGSNLHEVKVPNSDQLELSNNLGPSALVETNTDFNPTNLVPISLWLAFVEMRRKIRKPMTALAIQLLLAKLQRFADQGDDPIEVLEQSIVNCWQDIFPVKENQNGRRAESFQERNIRRTDEEIGEVRERARDVLSEVAEDFSKPSSE